MDKVLICGYGISGQAAARLAVKLGHGVVIADEHDSPGMQSAAGQLRDGGAEVQFISNWRKGVGLPVCGTVIVSPGIRKGTALFEAAQQALAPGGQWLSELEFALRNISCPFVSITGTNGKTTTTELTTALLRANGVNAESSGNIGAALSECVLEAGERKTGCMVIETSSFQLENIAHFPGCPAAVLNIASDHIDRHGSLEEYARTKFKVFAAPLPAEQRIMNLSLRPWLDKFLPRTAVTTFSAGHAGGDFTLESGWIVFRGRRIFELASGQLRGLHNAENMMAALALLQAVKGDDALFTEETVHALAGFHSGPHRMEVFLRQNGVTYVNDSKATNPHAVNAAVRQFANGRNLLLILGGLDKGMDFTELEVSFPQVKQAFLIGQCRDTLGAELAGRVSFRPCGSFPEAVQAACAAAGPGDVVMLSPATASMDMFKNYAERGDKFKQLVREYLDAMKKA